MRPTIMAVTIVSGAVVFVSPARGEEGLQVWYRFENGARDDSGRDHPGIVAGEPIVTTGALQHALQFDGIDDEVLIRWETPPDDYPLNGDDQSFTLMAWAKTADSSGDHWIFGNANGWRMLLFGLRDGQLQLTWRHGDSSSVFELPTGRTIAGGFVHVAAVYDAATRDAYVYMNGVAVASDTTTNPLGWRSRNNLTIGSGMWQGTPQRFDGIIDEVRIYDVALAPAQILRVIGADPADQDGPSVPEDFSATVGSSTHVSLHWSPATDPAGVAGYRVVRDGAEIAVTTLTEHTDYSALPGATYSYVLHPFDTIGNESASAPRNVTTPGHDPHPRLFFTAADVPGLQQKAQTTHNAIWQTIRGVAHSLLSTNPPDYPGQSSLYQSVFRDPMVLAFAHVITEDVQPPPAQTPYLDKAKEYLLALSSWPSWGGDVSTTEVDYENAYMVIGMALTYDWINDHLTESERATVRAALAEHVQELYTASSGPYSGTLSNWWRRSYAQNHWTQSVAGIGVGSLALEGEDDRTGEWLSHAITGLRRTQALYDGISDGTWHEGAHYQPSGQFMMVLPFYWMLEQQKQVSLFSEEYFRNYIDYALYNYLPGARHPALSHGDYVPSWGGYVVAGSSIYPRLFAGKYGDGHGEWVTQRILETVGRASYHVAAHVFEFFYYDDAVAPEPPLDKPLRCVFPDLGIAIWRTGWGEDDLVFGLKSGSYCGRYAYDRFMSRAYPFEQRDSDVNDGHGHQDAGTFYLFRGGRDLASEMLDWFGYDSEGTSAHNVILIDDKPQLRPARCCYEDFDAKLEVTRGAGAFDYLMADPTNRYREENDDGTPGPLIIDEHARHVLFARPDYFVMIDSLRADAAHRYQWVSHFSEQPAATVTVEGRWIKATENTPQADVLGVGVLSPASFAYEIGESAHIGSASPPKPYVRIRPATDVATMRFVNVLYPTNEAGWSGKPSITLLGDDESAVGVRVVRGDTHDHLIRLNAAASAAVGEYVFSARAASIYKNAQGKHVRLFIADGRSIHDQQGARLVLDSGQTTTLEAVFSGIALSVIAPEDLAGPLTLYAPETSIDAVTLNGESAPVVKNGDYLTIRSTPTRPRGLRVREHIALEP
jgi:hypothetical protein